MALKIRTRVSVGDDSIEDFEAFQDELSFTDGEKIEAATGVFFDQWIDMIDQGSATARRALVWLVKRQKTPTLLISAVNVPMRALKIENLSYCPKCEKDTQIARTRARPKTFCSACEADYPDTEAAPAVVRNPTEEAAPQASEKDEDATPSSRRTSGRASGPGSGGT